MTTTDSMLAMTPAEMQLVVRFSSRGKECHWCRSWASEDRDGPADAAELIRRFIVEGTSAADGQVPVTAPTAETVRLRVVPVRPGGPQVEVAPVPGQGLRAFLERTCREENGVFQLRAVFSAPPGEGYVRVHVAFPGMATSEAAAGGSEGAMLIEQFECEAAGDVAALKCMIQARTNFPASRSVLLLGCRRIHDELPMPRVAAAVEAAGAPLQLHLAASGAYVFLRREGQGHREPSGPCTLTLLLPPCVMGALNRPMAFDPKQLLGDLRWSVQAVSGLPPSGLRFILAAPRERCLTDAETGETLEALGFVDGCTLQVRCDLAIDSTPGDLFDMPLDTPTAGDASALYERAAARLGMPDLSRLKLVAGVTAISPGASLSCAPLADGVVLSAYVAWSLQLSASVLMRNHECILGVGAGGSGGSSSSAGSASTSPASTAGSGAGGADSAAALPATVACLSSDTIGEIRERFMGSVAIARADVAAKLRGSKVFAIDRSVWAASGEECSSLAALARLLGHFTPCSEGARLSRLGIADGGGHLVFVPEKMLLVEIEVQIGGEVPLLRKMRVPGSTRLMELMGLLERSLQEQPSPQRLAFEPGLCQWYLGGGNAEGVGTDVANEGGGAGGAGAVGAAQGTSDPGSPRGACFVASMVGSAAAAVVAKGKRKSFGGGAIAADDSSGEKRRRLSGPGGGSSTGLSELSDNEFLEDLHEKHPVGPKELPGHFLCPISYDVMRDPVVVVGSGNTYDRKSIEQHFRHRHTDPLTNVELRRSAERRLVPNNTLRSQIDEAERSQVDLRLTAVLGEQRRGHCGGDLGGMTAYLSLCASLLRGFV